MARRNGASIRLYYSRNRPPAKTNALSFTDFPRGFVFHPLPLYAVLMTGKEMQLLEDALKLPPEARAALAGSLLDSLQGEVDENAEEIWSAEIARRLKEIDSGTVRMIPWSEVRRDILKARDGRN